MDTIQSLIYDLTGKQVIPLPELTTLWLEWFTGDVRDFHHYFVYNGEKEVPATRRTLNMAKKVAEDWANLLLNEKTDIAYGDDEQQQQLWDMLKSVNFWQKGNQGIEMTFALGNGAFVESFDEDGKLRLQFVNATKIYPLNFEQDKITECAFINVNALTTVIQIHERGSTFEIEGKKGFRADRNGNYIIRTLVFKKQTLKDKTLGEKISDDYFDTKDKIAWFQMVKPNIANNIDVNSPMGISIFANALNSMEGVDLAYDGFCEEMRLGQAKIFLDKRLTHYDESGKHVIFDVNEKGFYWLGGSDGTDKAQPLTFYAPALRTDSYFNGINNALNLLSAKCGFGENHYRFDENGIATATQVISQNSEMFRTIKKHELVLYDVLVDMVKALMYIHNEFIVSDYKFDLNANIEVKFDDSIIEDKATEMLNDRQDLASGVMSKVEYRMKWYNEDEATARAKIDEIDAERQTAMGNFFSQEE